MSLVSEKYVTCLTMPAVSLHILFINDETELNQDLLVHRATRRLTFPNHKVKSKENQTIVER